MRCFRDSAAIFSVVLSLGIVGIFLYPSIAFHHAVRNGMSIAAIEQLYGKPDFILLPGDELPRWGNHRAVNVECIVYGYFIFPKRLHRFLIFVRDNTAARVEHQLN